MRILLIKPPLNKNLLAPNNDEPLELEYVAASVKDHEVDILDMRIEKNLWKKLGNFRPDLVGVTAYTCDVRAAEKVLQEVKKFSSSINTVVGGHHATVLPGDFALPFVDAIFIGMADHSFGQYVGLLDSGRDVGETKNIVQIKNGDLQFTGLTPFAASLDSLPLPARDLTRRYRKHYRDSMKNITGLIVTSRGCPYRCSFCACWKVMKGKYVTRSPESVMAEYAALPEEIELVCFSDDNTLHDTGRAWRLANLIKATGIKKRFMMYARTDVIVNHPDLIVGLREIGLEYLLVGIESFRDEELKKLNKGGAAKINIEALRILKKMGISVSPHLIVDPDFTREDFRQLFRYVCDMEIFRPVFTVLTPLPGTELYEKNYKRLAIRDYDFFDFTHAVLPTRLKRREFYRQYASLYSKSYSFRRYFLRKLRSLVDLGRKKKRCAPPAADRISFLQLALLRVFALHMYRKVSRRYKVEPLV
jgi:radical SAM superfamily enzyme YgiQ (UPF0313 family)